MRLLTLIYLVYTEDRRKKIANVALLLFIERGYHATSTRLIAQEARVSEGLIFRHYTNKEVY